MNLLDATNDIIRVTKRPDKLQSTIDAVNEAIAFAALRNFSADNKEITLPIDQTLYTQRIDLTNATYWIRFRKINYIRPTGYKKYLTFRSPALAWEEGIQALDVWYRSGSGIIINLSTLQATLEIGYYQYHTKLVADADTDWMLDEIWSFIKNYAQGIIFGEIGDDAERQKYEVRANRLLEAYTNDLADGVGHGG